MNSSISFCGDWLPESVLKPDMRKECLKIGNLECVITDQACDGQKAYSVVLNEQAIDRISISGFKALCLANNHVYDAGDAAFDEMVKNLCKKAPNTQFYGTSNMPYAVLSLGNRTCAVIGCLERCRSRGARIYKEENVLKLIPRIRNQFDCVFVTPHWGKEGEYAFHPSPRQRKLAGKWIRAGADGVFGHHSHTIQGSERIDGKPVFYSLGNFSFPHEESSQYPLTSYGAVVEVECKKLSYRLTFSQFQGDGSVRSISNSRQVFLDKWHSRLSEDLVKPGLPWILFRWAKAVGPIYIPKSEKSWSIRKQKAYLKTTLMSLIWFILPINLLLRIGKRLSKINYSLEATELEKILTTTARSDESAETSP